MKLCEIRIKPKSFFGTPFKGDTIFGHFCWQAKYDNSLLKKGLEEWIACYDQRPFAVFSSAWPVIYRDGSYYYALKRPDYPLKVLSKASFDDKKRFYEERKQILNKRWILVGEDLRIRVTKERMNTDADLAPRGEKRIRGDFIQPHNSINRLTMTTGEDTFAPYIKRNHYYHPDLELVVFVLFDEEATDIENINRGLEQIGKVGFGRDASTGLGRFDVLKVVEKPIPKKEGENACYALSPVVPETDLYVGIYFTPFTRFGRHGDVLATSSHPFKAPIIMADEGAVLVPKDHRVWEKPYIGRAITGISKVAEQTVAQGYSIYLPLNVE
ncbi:MAG: hypothetical protein N2572_08920 [Syntrophales bacterium]|nr:hypothetical protein [Syntrophales bacterium]